MSNKKCNAELRPAERPAFCRACDTKIEKGYYMISFYWRNRGQHIHICLDCSGKIGDMVNAPTNKNTISKEDIVRTGITPMVLTDDDFG